MFKTMRNGLFFSLAIMLGAFFYSPKAIIAAPLASQNEVFLGNANAPITIIEYGSLTCSHCALFQKNVFPTLMAKYINTGKVKYIFRTLPTNPIELATGLQVLADCAGGQKRYELIDEFFAQQGLIFAAARSQAGPLAAALRIAKSKGLSEDNARECLNNDEMIEHVRNVAQNGSITYKIDSTPSFIMNGKLLSGPNFETHTIEGFSKIIDAALAKTNKVKPKPKNKKASQ